MPKDNRETIPQSTCQMYQSFRGKHQILKQAKPAGKGGQKANTQKDLYPVTSPRIPLDIQKRGPRSVPSLSQPGPIHNLGEVGPYDTSVTVMFSAEQLVSSSADSLRLSCCVYLPTTATYPGLLIHDSVPVASIPLIGGVVMLQLYHPYGFFRLTG
ncbi:hypothetical protein B0H65DRAFT_573381 [Neurospora tetraspora]|uniref:Uncharacterized protein n=1 Tax=Neurospora tetraspora TaxID=94610 RepID=A0AAE0MSQ5_9PEZI|nr:hypothetical protein B0H65DRAFT_573381 [Neurospora tetraspora]